MSVSGSKVWRSNGGFTVIELLAVVTVIAIVSGIAIPSLFRSRAAANETATIGSFRALHTAQLSYSLSCGFGFYAASLTALGAGPGLPAFLSEDLTGSPTPTKSGYQFGLVPAATAVAGPPDCVGSGATVSNYYATAIPTSVASTGNRGFAIDQAGAIWQDVTGVAPLEPFTVSATVSPIQ